MAKSEQDTIMLALESLPLDQLDISRSEYFKDDTARALFKRLRSEAPIHYRAESEFGAFWSITGHRHIQEIMSRPLLYSSAGENGGVSIFEDSGLGDQGQMEMFLMMDPPGHAAKRKVVAPAFTPSEMLRLTAEIRKRTAEKLDSLPRGEVFDWTSEVAVSLTTAMLVALFDFPEEDSHRLPVWSDAVTSNEMMKTDPQGRQMLMFEMAMKFMGLWQQRLDAEPGPDLLSRMIHSDALSKMDQQEFIGNMALLVVGGNDTTRNSMSALIDVIHRWPEEWEKIKADRSLIPNAANELIRWYSPVVHVRRTAMEDHDFHGFKFRKGDKIVTWIISGNRDEAVFADPDRFLADRENARRHIAFGHGIHRCVGARLAELQLQTLIEEMADRDMRVELAGEIVREGHILVNAINSVPVRIAA
jgi:cytochrome P450